MSSPGPKEAKEKSPSGVRKPGMGILFCPKSRRSLFSFVQPVYAPDAPLRIGQDDLSVVGEGCR